MWTPGGDGTMAQVINELPSGVPLAVLPLGTEIDEWIRTQRHKVMYRDETKVD